LADIYLAHIVIVSRVAHDGIDNQLCVNVCMIF